MPCKMLYTAHCHVMMHSFEATNSKCEIILSAYNSNATHNDVFLTYPTINCQACTLTARR